MVFGKSIDDRAGVVMMLETMKELDKLVFSGKFISWQPPREEVGTRGAIISTYSVDPDIGIAVDVTHGDTRTHQKMRPMPWTRGPASQLGQICIPN